MSLTPEGFDRPRLNDIKSDLDQRFTDALGPVYTGADSVIGQIIGILSAAYDDAYEALQNTYDSMYPASAEGVSLDGAVSFVGMTRIDASPTTVVAMAYGAESTLIPSGSVARSMAGRQFVTTSDSVITRAAAGDVIISVNSVLNSTAYQIIVNGSSVTFTSDANATALEILNGLQALFNPVNVLATIESSKLRLRAPDLYSDFTLTVDSKLTIDKLGSPVTFTALDLGAYELPAGALNIIDSPKLGWDSVSNLVPGAIGRFVESDEALRARHAIGVRATGAATLKAIRARLLAEVDSVTYVAVYENYTNFTDSDSLPAHSFEAVVSGGLDQAVANKIYEVKPAGIETYGNTTIQVIDENGDVQVVKFSRGTTKYAWIRVTVNALDLEEPLTLQVIDAIKNAVVAYGNNIGIGNDIITQRFYGPIFAATSGLGNITVEAAITNLPGDTPTYSTNNVVLSRREQALFDVSRVVVVGV